MILSWSPVTSRKPMAIETTWLSPVANMRPSAWLAEHTLGGSFRAPWLVSCLGTHMYNSPFDKRGRHGSLRIVLGALAAGASFADRFLEQQARARSSSIKGRPTYIGCTESGEVREQVCRELLRAWPGGPVGEFWSVVGGLSGFDALATLDMARISVERIVLFDRDPSQLQFGQLLVQLVQQCPTRERFVQCLFGRSMEAWGRILTASTMLDFLDMPMDNGIKAEVMASLPEDMKNLYSVVFDCMACRRGWPLVWPSFGTSQRLPLRDLPNAKRRLGGTRNETLHINEAGWLKSERSYLRVHDQISRAPLEYRLLELADFKDLPLCKSPRVLFISNVDTGAQFLGGTQLEALKEHLQVAVAGTLLLSTSRAEWLGGTSNLDVQTPCT